MDAGKSSVMKVILSTDPIKFPLTGIGRYTYELACGLQQSGLDDLQFLRGLKLQTDLPTPVSRNPMAETSKWKLFAQRTPFAVSLFQSINPKLKGFILRNKGNYIFHGPNYYLPPFAGKSVVTIHDLSAFLWPECHPPERVRYMQTEIKLSLKRASALITDTEHTRQEVASYFSYPLERIYAIPLASGKEFKPRSTKSLVQKLQNINLRPNEYTLFTGTIEPRKNLATLLNAYERLPKPLRYRFPLVIAGYKGWKSEGIHQRISKAQQEGWAQYLGFISQEHLPSLMAGARLFAYPSLYEGFGLPVLEAMASGTPVICSNSSTLPEIAGSAASFHDPYDVDTLTNLLRIGLEDSDWRDTARKTSIDRAKCFSWDHCVQETLKVYHQLLRP